MELKLERYKTNIPNELKVNKNFVGVEKDTKRPLNLKNGRGANICNKDELSSFTACLTALYAYSCAIDFIGYVFLNEGYVGIDIDNALTRAWDIYSIKDEYLEIIYKFKSYTEISKSGKGIHIIVKGDIFTDGLNNFNGIEIYKNKRYFILTANLYRDFKEIKECQNELDWLVNKYFLNKENGTVKKESYVPIYKKDKIIKRSNIYIFDLRYELPYVSCGGRHMALLSFIGRLKYIGYNKQEAYRESLKVNSKKFEKPLNQNEIISIIESVYKGGKESD